MKLVLDCAARLGRAVVTVGLDDHVTLRPQERSPPRRQGGLQRLWPMVLRAAGFVVRNGHRLLQRVEDSPALDALWNADERLTSPRTQKALP